MLSFIRILFSIIVLLAFISCGKSNKEKEQKQYHEAQEALSSRNYETAALILEDLVQKDQQNMNYKKKLVHAYAGLAGFEALSFLKLIERMKEFKLPTKIDSLEMFVDLDLNVFPQFNFSQRNNLNKAIHLADQFGDSFFYYGKENNMRFGVLKLYRMMGTLRDLGDFVKVFIKDYKNISRKQFERNFFEKLISIDNDLIDFHTHFTHSYQKLQVIASQLQGLINAILSGKNTIKNSEGIVSLEYDNVSSILKKNKTLFVEVFTRLNTHYQLPEAEAYFQILKNNFSGSKGEFNQEYSYLKTFFSTVYSSLIENNEIADSAKIIEAFITKDSLHELRSVIEKTFKMRDPEILRNYFETSTQNLDKLKVAIDLIKGTKTIDDIEANTQESYEVLLKSLGKEHLKSLKSRLDALFSISSDDPYLKAEFASLEKIFKDLTDGNIELVSKHLNTEGMILFHDLEKRIVQLENTLNSFVQDDE